MQKPRVLGALLSLSWLLASGCGGDGASQPAAATNVGGAGGAGGVGEAGAGGAGGAAGASGGDSGGATGGGGGAAPSLVFTACDGAGIDCATVDVPVDYDHPAASSVGIRIARLRAKKPEARIGVLLLNNGGPGVPMVAQFKQVSTTLKLTYPELADRFDLIGFDWRGVGLSGPIDCVDDSYLDTIRTVPITPKDAAGVAAIDDIATTVSTGCSARTSPALLQRLDTENAARDLDSVRVALGEEQLNYLGVSYGTWLGATYASMFPSRLRAFVLDSCVGPSPSRLVSIERQAKGYEVALGRFFADCAARASCPFHGGTDVTTLEAAWDVLVTRAATDGIPAGARTAHEFDVIGAAFDALRSYSWASLAMALSQLEAGDGGLVLQLADGATGRASDGTYGNFVEALLGIGCLDIPYPQGTTTADVEMFADGLRATYPRMTAGVTVPWYVCTRWPFSHSAAPIAAPTAPPLLLIGGRYDPATVYEEAGLLRDALGNGSHLLTYEGDGHAALTHSECARQAMKAFFLDPSMSPVDSCPAE